MKKYMLFLILFCASWMNLNAQCSCSISLAPNNNPCGYTIAISTPSCTAPVTGSISINTATNPSSCDIFSLTSSNSTVNITSNTTATITSPSGGWNSSSGSINVADLVITNAVSPLSVVELYMTLTDAAGVQIECIKYYEIDGTCSLGPPVPIDKICGDFEDNIPVKVIPVGSNKMQVLGNQMINGQEHGTLFQVDLATQQIDWQISGPDTSRFMDVAYNPITHESVVVGHTLPFIIGSTSFDSKSIIYKFNKNGVCTAQRTYDQTGRDFFRKIIYNQHASNPKFTYYVVGAKNASSVPDNLDALFLFSMQENLNVNWYRKIHMNGDDEVYRGIIPRQNADGVMIVGNSSTNNRGVFIDIDHLGNHILPSAYLDAGIDLYDGHYFSNGNKLLIGEDFYQGFAIISYRDPTNGNIDGIKFTDLQSFHELTFDGHYFYTVAQQKAVPHKNIIVKFHINGNNIVVDGKYFVSNGETDFKLGSINYHTGGNGLILYADGRIPQTGGAGGYDTYYAAYDKLFSSSNCLDSLPLNQLPYSVSAVNINIAVSNDNLPPNQDNGMCGQLDYSCNMYCVPSSCLAGFTWQQKNCHQVQFTNTSTGVAPVTYSWDFPGGSTVDATTPNPLWNFNTPGIYWACLTITGADGCTDQYCDSIKVIAETDPPSISCPNNIFVNVPACEGGKIINFSPPTASDACGMVTTSCDHLSGDFYPCGNTVVQCTAIDDWGNQSTCNFNININCLCAQTNAQDITCGTDPDQFYFTFEVEDISGATGCTAAISLPNNIGILSNLTQSWNGPKLTVSGTIDATAYPFPTSFPVRIDFTCSCPNQTTHTCTHDVYFTTPCCDSATIDDAELCKTADQLFVDLNFFGTVNDIVQIEYYVLDASGPCPSTYWGGIPFQTSLGYKPLRILPKYHTNDICVYAEIFLGSDEAPCTKLVTDIQRIKLCSPITCSLPNQEFCYTGIPITAAPIVYSGPLPDCAYTIEWYDPNGQLLPLPPNTLSYQPPPLIYNSTLGGCSQTYTYEMRISGVCPTQSCFSNITLWNLDADKGDLYLDPLESLPLCPGEDLSIRYDKKCTAPTDLWTWKSSPNGVTYTPIPGAGTANPYYNTNRLYQDIWYQVERTNGVCPSDTVNLFIPVKPPLTVTKFNAYPLNACRDNGLKLSVQYTPCVPSINGVCNCNYTIEWYKNGFKIGSFQSSNPQLSWSYIDPALNGNYAGVYYAIVTDNCCGQTQKSPIDIVQPPLGLVIAAPCYICQPNTTFTLNGIIINSPSNGICTFQWYYDNGTGYQLLSGSTNQNLQSNKPGKYQLRMTCTLGSIVCTKIAKFEVMNCFPANATTAGYLEGLDFKIAPNPSFSYADIIFDGIVKDGTYLFIYNINGQQVFNQKLLSNQERIRVKNLQPGTYIVSIRSKSEGSLHKKLIVIE